jgi:hypothetical protein
MRALKSVGSSVVAAVAIAVAAASTGTAGAGSTEPPSPSHHGEASVELTAPADFAHVAGAVPVAMAASGITIEPAGESHDGAGHFHVIADAGCLPEGESIVKDPDHVHFGQGQTEGLIYLAPGRHELCLQVGDGIHLALDVTDSVTIDVGGGSTEEWCAVIGQLDELLTATDGSDDELTAKQLGYANAHRLVAQLRDGLEYVDDDARADVDAAMTFVDELLGVIVAAPDEATLETDVETVYAGVADDESFPGIDWIRDSCGVGVDD